MMASLTRRQLLLGAAATLATRLAGAQDAKDWPARPVKVIVPGGAGGVLDTLARQLYARLQETLGQPFVIENRPGANGLIGSAAVKNAAPDGYTILHSTASSMVMAEALNPAIPVKALRDLEPVALSSVGGVLLVAHPSVPARTLPELVELLRGDPDKYPSYGSWGIGSNGHLTMEWIKQRAGLRINHVPYKTTPALLANVVSGELPIGWLDVVSPLGFIAQGKLRGIALTGTVRSPRLPEVEVLSEQGYPFTAAGWQGIFAPKGTPPEIVERLHVAINHEQVQPAFRDALRQANVPPAEAVSRQAFVQTMKDDLATWRKVVVDGNIQPE
ncbi:Bug family tripartite tricarboxylate transporter substrate binding protein [Achromobacter denitrificans]|uniref:Bug family tripartite tricarboxylate transporter substrate binding protein n=1 Tax=Achromobacter denitrificans TaxID=32002 RepID=UPI0009EBF387|nr:tripartite tricarboxylate transporter substrate binding protein [Achromobacter denitrificans]QKH40470.1 tripartite tricarboxylate transporter substrate binding protein [Achromobacter denitrificans]QKH52385.1 tripartite tricarboxylate transporter substrate binding protein [Achromobacter denitrificans]